MSQKNSSEDEPQDWKICGRGIHKYTGRRCRECQKANIKRWFESDKGKAKRKEYRAKYRSDPEYKKRERQYDRDRHYRLYANSESYRERKRKTTRRWYMENTERALATHKKHYLENKEAHKVRNAKWREANRHIVSGYSSARRARERSAHGSHTGEEWEAIKAKQRGRCNMCKKRRKLTRDHIIPLARGGSNYAFNIQGLCKPCNTAKRDRLASGAQHSLWDKHDAA